jgi:hypothetical protein
MVTPNDTPRADSSRPGSTAQTGSASAPMKASGWEKAARAMRDIRAYTLLGVLVVGSIWAMANGAAPLGWLFLGLAVVMFAVYRLLSLIGRRR